MIAQLVLRTPRIGGGHLAQSLAKPAMTANVISIGGTTTGAACYPMKFYGALLRETTAWSAAERIALQTYLGGKCGLSI